MSDATEVPPLFEDFAEVTPTESFAQVIEWENVKFNVVKLFHPQKGGVTSLVNQRSVFPDTRLRYPRYALAGRTGYRGCGSSLSLGTSQHLVRVTLLFDKSRYLRRLAYHHQF